MYRSRVAVVGSGPAGCAAAYRLRCQGHEVVLLEKAPSVGGRLYTHRADGFHLDTGAAFVTSRHYPRLHALADEVGFSGLIRNMNRITGLHHEGQGASLDISSVRSFLSYRFLKLRDKLKMGLWTLGMARKGDRYDLADPATVRDVDHRSVAEFARDRLGDDIYDYLVRPSMEPFWYAQCEEVSEGMFLALSARAPGAKFFCVEGGIDQICSRLSEGVELRCDTEVLEVEPRGQGVALRYRDVRGEGYLEADRVVVASTANVAWKLTAALPAAMVSEAQKDFLASQRYAPNIHACFRVPRMEKPPEVNAIFPAGPGPRPWAGLSFQRAKDAGFAKRDEELVSFYLSGPESARMMEAPEHDVYAHSLAMVRKIYPEFPGEVTPFLLTRRREAIPIHEVGRYGRADDFQKEQQARGGPVVFCGDYLASATIEGAVATGLAASAICQEDVSLLSRRESASLQHSLAVNDLPVSQPLGQGALVRRTMALIA